jgi:hypothetical protein
MKTYIDDNFGTWTGMDDPETVKFYHQCQRTNVTKQCSRCERTVRIQPNYSICGSCADAAESGMDY